MALRLCTTIATSMPSRAWSKNWGCIRRNEEGPMEIKPIRTKADRRAALKEIEALMSARQGIPEGERLDVLVTLVEAYEGKHFPMDLPDPIEAIRFSMEQKGLTAKDLVPMIGQINRVYKCLTASAR